MPLFIKPPLIIKDKSRALKIPYYFYKEPDHDELGCVFEVIRGAYKKIQRN